MKKDNPAILHLDDNGSCLEIFRKQFKDVFDIVSCENYKEALRLLSKGKFDAVVSDYEMPDINGIEFLKIVKNRFHFLPVILYTGQGNEEVAREAFLAGASDYFTKYQSGVLFREKFINSVNNIVERKQAEYNRKLAEDALLNMHKELEEMVEKRTVELINLNQALRKEIKARRNYELELKKSKEKYETLVENINDIIYSVDTRGVITYVSPRIGIYGYKPEEVAGRSIFDFVIPEDIESIAKQFKTTMETGREFITIIRILDKEGNIRWLEEQGKLIKNRSGQAVAINGVTRDITTREKLKQEIIEKKSKYEAIFRNIEVGGIFIKDGKIEEANPQFLKFLEIDFKQLENIRFVDLMVKETEQIEKLNGIFKSLNEKSPQRETFVLRKPDGSNFRAFMEFYKMNSHKTDHFFAIVKAGE
ncbi:MAG: PAS domain S-box protein [Vulcanimicrobiota bacterium]